MYYEWSPYVSVAQRLANARKYAARLAKKERRELAPVKVTGRKLASKFWGQAWCENLDQYSDFANRLPRGRRYLGNGSVVDLQIRSGQVKAIVAGSETYHVSIKIKTLPPKTWKALQKDCSQSIHSLLDLLQGRFDEGVMQRIACREGGLFPRPNEIAMECSCPDYAQVCKHIAAVVYGIGVRLDTSPELLFTLRNVDHSQLITQAIAAENLEQSLTSAIPVLADENLGELFGIDLQSGVEASTEQPSLKSRQPRKAKAVVTVVGDSQESKSKRPLSSGRSKVAKKKPSIRAAARTDKKKQVAK